VTARLATAGAGILVVDLSEQPTALVESRCGSLLGIHQSAFTDAVREIVPILTALEYPVTKAPGAVDLTRLVGRTED
jgi:hypothetical protein